jgi:Trypsin-co-occurring domain 2/Coenzyme PQQ synthesis protein D (PqqD)
MGGCGDVGDGAESLPSLADTIAAVRRDLCAALADGYGQPVRFRAGPVELDFGVAVTCTGGGQEGVRLSVLTNQDALAGATTQRVKVTLQPLDADTGADAPTAGIPERPARAGGLEVQEVADGLMVYQAEPECVHQLNNTAAVVFELCDGHNTVPEISEQLAAAFGHNGVPADAAYSCIADLWSKGVIW